MILTADNYYSREADQEYLSVSQFKEFVGTLGKPGCEFHAMERLAGRWEDEKTLPLMVGSYVDSWFEGSLDRFKEENPDCFTRGGDLKRPLLIKEVLYVFCKRTCESLIL